MAGRSARIKRMKRSIFSATRASEHIPESEERVVRCKVATLDRSALHDLVVYPEQP